MMVRDFQSVIGREARAQCLQYTGRLPDTLVACVGGGSNAIGTVPSVHRRSDGSDWSASKQVGLASRQGNTLRRCLPGGPAFCTVVERI